MKATAAGTGRAAGRDDPELPHEKVEGGTPSPSTTPKRSRTRSRIHERDGRPGRSDGCAKQLLAGRWPLKTTHRLRVRYNECDRVGIVFNSNYLRLHRRGGYRVLARAPGWLFEFNEIGLDMVLAEANLRFRQPLEFGRRFDIRVSVGGMTARSMTIEFNSPERRGDRRDRDLLRLRRQPNTLPADPGQHPVLGVTRLPDRPRLPGLAGLFQTAAGHSRLDLQLLAALRAPPDLDRDLPGDGPVACPEGGDLTGFTSRPVFFGTTVLRVRFPVCCSPLFETLAVGVTVGSGLHLFGSVSNPNETFAGVRFLAVPESRIVRDPLPGSGDLQLRFVASGRGSASDR